MPDYILVSSDDVHFYVHSPVLLSASSNMFGGLLSPQRNHEDDGRIISLEESSSVLNVILLATYFIPCSPYEPSPDTILAAIEALPKYGLLPDEHLSPSTPLYAAAVAAAQHAPMDFYTAAAALRVGPLATAASRHLRSLDLMHTSDAQAQRMGAVYYKKLAVMLQRRSDQLRRLLYAPPTPHPRTPACTEANQRFLHEAWILLLSELGTNLFRYTSSQTVVSREGGLLALLACDDCKLAVAARFQALQIQLGILDEQYMVQ